MTVTMAAQIRQLLQAASFDVGVNPYGDKPDVYILNSSDRERVTAAARWFEEFNEGDVKVTDTLDGDRFRFVTVEFV